MTRWSQGTIEERVLLNPAFCASVLWHFASAGAEAGTRPLTFVESFLVLPIVLHRATRDSLPRSTRTSFSVWLDENPTSRSTIAARARLLVPFTKDAILFGGMHRVIRLENDVISADMSWKKKINAALREGTDEVRLCAKRASFVGTWFQTSGSATTVMALLGVRP